MVESIYISLKQESILTLETLYHIDDLYATAVSD